MLNLPDSDAAENARPERPQSPRLVRRRPLSGGERLRGWADVRELHGDSDGDGRACVPKYHVDLNLTAHLDWDEWQRLCAAEPTQQDAPTLCILSTIGGLPTSNGITAERPEEDETEEREDDPPAAPQREEVRRSARHQRPPSAPLA